MLESAKTCTSPCLPRLVALEALYTIHLLFSHSQESAKKLIKKLQEEQDFDRDFGYFGTADKSEYPHEKACVAQFPVWGSRLRDLWDEIRDPSPRTTVDNWLERMSKSRYTAMIAIIGLVTTVVVGVLTLVVAVLQLWIAWRQWVEPSDSQKKP